MMMQQNNGDLWLYTYNPSLNTFSGQEVGAVGRTSMWSALVSLAPRARTRC